VLVRGWYAQLIETDQQARGVFERRAGACATVATIGLGAARLPGLRAVLRGGEVSRFPMPRLNVLELPALGREHA
jgi:hypothetical protein